MNDKIPHFIRLLDSPHDGEVVSAARMLKKALAADNKDFHWLADNVGVRGTVHRPGSEDWFKDREEENRQEQNHRMRERQERAEAIRAAKLAGTYDERYGTISDTETPREAAGRLHWMFDHLPFLSKLHDSEKDWIRRVEKQGSYSRNHSRIRIMFMDCCRKHWPLPAPSLAVVKAARAKADAEKEAARKAAVAARAEAKRMEKARAEAADLL